MTTSMRAAPPRDGATPELIAIASGKGGVGKTWLAISLAQALARLGCSVLLFDGDLGLANVDVQLGLTPGYDLGDMLDRAVPLATVVTRHEQGGFDVLAGRSGSGALAGLDPAMLDAGLAALRQSAGQYDAILLDLGAGVGRAVRRMAARSDRVLVVATEEPTSLTDAYAVLKLLYADRPDADAALVINQATTHAAGERTHATLLRACRSFLHRAPGLAGVIRRDDRVRDAIRRQTPLLTRHPGCPAAADVEALASRLLTPWPVSGAAPPAPSPRSAAAAG